MPRSAKSAPQSYRATQVINHIRSLIEAGLLLPGDRLPPEREFARTLNISRASLRTGIGHLTAMGVMTVRHGIGTFVTEGPPDLGKSSLAFLGALHGFKPWQMYEARIVLESNLAALAAERGTRKHHAELAEEVQKMFEHVDSPADYLIHDVKFHRAIAQASGNPILAAIMDTVTSSMYETRRRTVQRAVDLSRAASMHRRIYRAISTHKPLQARRLMELHLRMAETAQRAERPKRVNSNSTPANAMQLSHKKKG